MQVAEFISIQATRISSSSWKWWHFLYDVVLLLFKVRVACINRNRNIPVFTYIVQHSTNMHHLAHLQWWADPDLTVQDMKSVFQLPSASLDNTACLLVNPERKHQ